MILKRAWRQLFAGYCLAVLCAAASAAPPGSLRFEPLGVAQGLAQETVNAVGQDAQGFMWFGSQNGLSRYDGYRVIVYKHVPADPNSLADNWVQALYADGRGRLWVGSRGGLQRYDSATERFVHFLPNEPNNRGAGHKSIQTIIGDGKDGLWIGTEDGLQHFDPASGRFTILHHDAADKFSLSKDKVNALARDAQGNLWVATAGGVDRLPAGATRFEHFTTATAKSPEAYRLLVDREQALWVVTAGGLEIWRMDDGVLSKRRVGDDYWFRREQITSLLQDRDGNIWAGNYADGLHCWDPAENRFVSYPHQPNDPHSMADNASTLFQDRAGTLWVGTWTEGAKRVDLAGGGFKRYSFMAADAKNTNGNKVFSITGAERERLWLNTNDGLKKLDPATGQVTVFKAETDGVERPNIGQVAVGMGDKQARAWLESKVNAVTGSVMAPSFNTGDPNSDVLRRVMSDHQGKLWIVSHGGLHQIDPATNAVQTYRHDPAVPDSLADNWVITIMEDRQHRLWIGTQAGLDRLEGASGRFTHFRQDPKNVSGLSHDRIQYLFEDKQGTLWVGTAGGLNRMQTSADGNVSFRVYTVKDGLGSDAIGGILDDMQGRLWISTAAGISRYDPGTDSFQNYTVRDGLIDGYYFAGSAFKAPDGTMYFGGVNGLTGFRPEKIHDNLPPPVFITDFRVDNQSLRTGSKLEGVALKEPIQNAREITLSHEHTAFSLEFAALQYADPQRNRYAYRLEGFDKDWVSTDAGKRTASYADLEPGRYVFHVKASNKDGVWNEQGAALGIVVMPPFWKTWWFYCLAAALMLGVLAGAYRFRHLLAQKLRIVRSAAPLAMDVSHSRTVLNNAELIIPASAETIEFPDLAGHREERLVSAGGGESADMLATGERSSMQMQAPEDTEAAGAFEQAQTPPAGQDARAPYLRWITATVGNSLRLIPVEDIIFFQSDQKYTRVVLAESEVLIKKSLKELLAELDPDQFWKIHRSIVVNALEVASIEPNMGGEMTAKLKKRRELLPVSDSFVRKLRHM